MRLPNTLYHYTSQAGLIGIVDSDTLWASDVLYLNDVSEYIYTADLAQKLVRKLRASHDKEDIKKFQSILESGLKEPLSRVYVCSFSEEGDLLSQWRGYCPSAGGFCLGFNRERLSEVSRTLGASFKKCIYDPSEQQALLYDILNTAVSQFPEEVEISPTVYELDTQDGGAGWSNIRTELLNRDRSIEDMVMRFTEEILRLAPLFKHPKFKEECEWRLSIEGTGVAHVTKYRQGSSFLIPYKVLPFALRKRKVLSEVIVGPCPHPRLSARAVGRFLRESLGYDVRVNNSTVPFRSW